MKHSNKQIFALAWCDMLALNEMRRFSSPHCVVSQQRKLSTLFITETRSLGKRQNFDF
jgi:hypothetical protein